MTLLLTVSLQVDIHDVWSWVPDPVVGILSVVHTAFSTAGFPPMMSFPYIFCGGRKSR